MEVDVALRLKRTDFGGTGSCGCLSLTNLNNAGSGNRCENWVGVSAEEIDCDTANSGEFKGFSGPSGAPFPYWWFLRFRISDAEDSSSSRGPDAVAGVFRRPSISATSTNPAETALAIINLNIGSVTVFRLFPKL